MRYGHEPPEAATYLGKNQLPLPPEWLRESGTEPPPSAPRSRAAAGELPPLPPRVKTERSSAKPVMVAAPRLARGSEPPVALPLPPAPPTPPAAKAHATPPPAVTPKKEKS